MKRRPHHKIHRWIVTGIACLLALGAITTLFAAPPSRGAYCVDGTCFVDSKHYGYFQTRWRRWPGTTAKAVPPKAAEEIPAPKRPGDDEPDTSGVDGFPFDETVPSIPPTQSLPPGIVLPGPEDGSEKLSPMDRDDAPPVPPANLKKNDSPFRTAPPAEKVKPPFEIPADVPAPDSKKPAPPTAEAGKLPSPFDTPRSKARLKKVPPPFDPFPADDKDDVKPKPDEKTSGQTGRWRQGPQHLGRTTPVMLQVPQNNVSVTRSGSGSSARDLFNRRPLRDRDARPAFREQSTPQNRTNPLRSNSVRSASSQPKHESAWRSSKPQPAEGKWTSAVQSRKTSRSANPLR